MTSFKWATEIFIYSGVQSFQSSPSCLFPIIRIRDPSSAQMVHSDGKFKTTRTQPPIFQDLSNKLTLGQLSFCIHWQQI